MCAGSVLNATNDILRVAEAETMVIEAICDWSANSIYLLTR